MYSHIYIEVPDFDNKLESEVNEILEPYGIDIDKVVELFLKRVVIHDMVLFDIDSTEQEYKMKKSTVRISAEEYAEYISQVPEGMLTRDTDFFDFISNAYQKDCICLDDKHRFKNKAGKDVPWWRMVSKNGFLLKRYLNSRYRQKKKLEEEGFNIVLGGKNGNSFMVENYKDYLFKDFKRLDENESND